MALRQTALVADALRERVGVACEEVIVASEGDRLTDLPIAEIGGVGVFTKLVEQAVLAGEADVAVHSLKDLPTTETAGLTVAAVPLRGSAGDLLLSRAGTGASDGLLHRGATVGTGSARRAAQMLHLQADVVIAPIRGNVPTRVEKLRAGAFDAVILAAAGIERLGLDLGGLTVVDLLAMGFLPAPGQGALAVQCRVDDASVRDVLARIHDDETATCVAAERGLLARLGGGCHAAVGCLGTVLGSGSIRLEAVTFADGVRRTANIEADRVADVIDACLEQVRG